MDTLEKTTVIMSFFLNLGLLVVVGFMLSDMIKRFRKDREMDDKMNESFEDLINHAKERCEECEKEMDRRWEEGTVIATAEEFAKVANEIHAANMEKAVEKFNNLEEGMETRVMLDEDGDRDIVTRNNKN